VFYLEELLVPVIRVYFSPKNFYSENAIYNGLTILHKLKQKLPLEIFSKVEIFVTRGTHFHKKKIDKELNDKERVEASFSNSEIVKTVQFLIGSQEEI
jgi:hypothetical protein